MPDTTPVWKLCVNKSTRVFEKCVWCEDTDSLNRIMVENEDYKEPQGILKQAIRNAARCEDVADDETITAQWHKNLKDFGLTTEDINAYLDIIPFTPSIMLNISPNWKGKYHVIDDDTEPHEKEYLLLENQRMEEALQMLVETYMRECNRFDYYDYVMEVGSEGNHLHAHIVGHVNPRLIRSVCGDSTKGSTKTSHFGKGNHVQQLLKISKGLKGIKGYVTRYGIQSSILRKDYLVNDKLDYLYEEKKPEGHKNLYVLWDSPKHVCV